MRVYELSKELGITNKELIDAAKSMGITVKSHASSIEEEEVKRIKGKFADQNQGSVQSDKTDQEPAKEIKEKVTVFKSESGQEVVERRKGRRVVLRKKKITESEAPADEKPDEESGATPDDMEVVTEKESVAQLDLKGVKDDTESKVDDIALKIDDQDLKKALSVDTADEGVEGQNKEDISAKSQKPKEKDLKPSDDQIDTDVGRLYG